MSRPRELLEAARSGEMRAIRPRMRLRLRPAEEAETRDLLVSQGGRTGSRRAQNYLGESYRDGWTVERDLRKAIHWFRLAAAQGDPDAQVSLGHSLFYGEGVKRDRSKAQLGIARPPDKETIQRR